jgi:hypothetical protein
MKAIGSRKLKGAILFFLALYTFLGFVILPILLQRFLEEKMTETLRRKVTIDNVVANPYALSLAIEGLKIMEKDASTVLFSCKRIYGNVEAVSLLKRSLVIREIDLLEPFVRVERFRDGGINLLALVPPEAKGKTEPAGETKPPDEKAGSTGIPVEVDRFALHGGTVRFTDRVPAEVFETTLSPMEVSVRNFRTEKGSRAAFSLSLATEISETLKTEGMFSLDPLFAEGTAAAGGLFPGKYFPYVRERLAFSWEKGNLDVTTRFLYRHGTPSPSASLSGLDVTLKDLSLLERGETRPFLRIPELAVRAVDADLIGGNVAVGEVASRDGTFLLKRLKDGSLNVAHLAATPEKGTTPSGGSAPPPPKDAGAAKSVPSVLLKTLAVEGWRILFEDRGLAAPASLEIRDLRLSGEGLSTSPGEKGKVSLAFRDPEDGTLSVGGTLEINPPVFQGNVLLKRIALYPFQPYVQETLDLLLTGGSLSVEGSLGVEKKKEPLPAVAFSGSVGLRDFSCSDGKRGEEMLRFKTLDILGIRFGLQPNLLKVGEVKGSDFYTRLAIREDLTANVTDILRKEEGAKAGEEAKPAAEGKKEEASKKKEEKPFFETVAIDRVTLDKGRIDFTDRHVKPAFSAHMYDMKGTISGMLSDDASRADVLLKGSYEKVIPLTIEGKINPLGKALYVDLKMVFENVDLSPLTPYGRKYLGYPIDKGKLFLNLKYHIENRKLDAQNVVLLDQFTLGDPVESPDALKLPIRLAIALLKDRQGKIDLDIPLTGQTDDPQFSIGRLVLKVLGNLIVKAVTAPFALLGSIFGGGEELGFVAFAPGAVQVDEEGQKKIDVLAKALYDRPLLKLEITGHTDPVADREALRKTRLEELIRAAKVRDMAGKGQKAPPSAQVAVDPKEYETYLGEVYRETVPADERKKIPEKTLSRVEREKIVLAHLEVSGGDLRQLAYERASRVRDHILATGKVEKERIFLIEPREPGPEGKDGESRVQFSLVN